MKTLIAILFSAALLSASPTDDVMAAMNAWKQAMLHRDAAALQKLYHPDITYSHSSGKLENKAEAIEAATNGKNVTEAIEIGDLKTRVYGNTALVRGDITITSNNNGAGPQTLKLNILHVWLKTGSGWQLVARQSTRLNP